MPNSPVLGLPLIVEGQGQQGVVHNEALIRLQALLIGAISVRNAPPGSPSSGDTYIVGTSGSGDWDGHDSKVATFYDNGWLFVPDVDDDGAEIVMGADQEGLEVYVRDRGDSPTTSGRMRWDGSAWIAL